MAMSNTTFTWWTFSWHHLPQLSGQSGRKPDSKLDNGSWQFEECVWARCLVKETCFFGDLCPHICWNYGRYVGGLCLYLLRGCNTWSEGLRRPPGRSTGGWTNKNWHDSKKKLKTETSESFLFFFDLKKHEKHFCFGRFFLGGGAGGGQGWWEIDQFLRWFIWVLVNM